MMGRILYAARFLFLLLSDYSAKIDVMDLAEEFTKNKKLLKDAIRRVVKSNEDAEDILQEVYIKAFKRISSLRNKSCVKSWLFKIARNAALNHINRLKPTISLEAWHLTQLTYSFETEKETLFARIKPFLDSLPSRQRQAFVLRIFEELTFKEISNKMSVSYDGAKANFFIAKRKFKKLDFRDKL